MTVSFDKKLAELDAYLQLLIEQTETLDKKIELASVGAEKDGLILIKNNLESLLGSIKHAIVLLQIAKVSIKTTNMPTTTPTNKYSFSSLSTSTSDSCGSNKSPPLIETTTSSTTAAITASLKEQQRQLDQAGTATNAPTNATNSSFSSSSPQPPARASRRRAQQGQQQLQCSSSSSSTQLKVSAHLDCQQQQQQPQQEEEDDDDDDFYDAADEHQQEQQPYIPKASTLITQNINSADILKQQQQPNFSIDDDDDSTAINNTMPDIINNNMVEDGSIDWDALYEEEEEDLGSLENQGSVIRHLMSQIRIGMDLTKVVLPTFILERRSLLEMYADFFAHPDLFSSIPDYDTPEERMIQLVKWYLSAFHAGRKSAVAKKPYNPILGEIFLCHWNLQSNNNNCNDNKPHQEQHIEHTDSTESSTPSVGDIERFSKQIPHNSLLFVAEQVSHHPPVSAFYAENPDKLISCHAHIYTKSKYLGLSVGVHNIGQGVINLLKHNETYVCTFPSAYGRSILTVPWVELGGSVDISCEQSGYSASIEFVTKPFYGGKKHRVMGEILRPNKESFMTIDGEWNGCMYSKSPPNSNDKEVFVDTTCLPVIKKNVRSISSQESFESRNVWKEVTRALKLRDVASATAAKSFIEQKQRDLLKARLEKGVKWKTRYFEAADDGWTYAKPLAERLSEP